MKLYFKCIAILTMAVLLGIDGAHAQEEKSAKEGEIVMRQSELDSLLNKIKFYRQKQREKERAVRMALSKSQYDSIMGKETDEVMRSQSSHRGYMNEERIYNEFARLNNRIDWMILNMAGAGSAPAQAANTRGGQPNVLYFDSDRDDDAQPFSPALMGVGDDTGANTSSKRTVVEEQKGDDSALKDAESKSSDLQNELAEMNEKARVLNKLQETTGSDEYNEELDGLNTRMEELKNELAESERRAEEERERLNSRRMALQALKEENFSIHFANNSTSLSDSDKKALRDLADKVKDNEDVTVVLHGYASKVGNAYYNEQLSYKRANGVRQVLRDAGITPGDIVIMPHGVDEGGNDDSARRVDIEVSAY